jgi:hypothetical protein
LLPRSLLRSLVTALVMNQVFAIRYEVGMSVGNGEVVHLRIGRHSRPASRTSRIARPRRGSPPPRRPSSPTSRCRHRRQRRPDGFGKTRQVPIGVASPSLAQDRLSRSACYTTRTQGKAGESSRFPGCSLPFSVPRHTSCLSEEVGSTVAL